jgi:hypothetical protein
MTPSLMPIVEPSGECQIGSPRWQSNSVDDQLNDVAVSRLARIPDRVG